MELFFSIKAFNSVGDAGWRIFWKTDRYARRKSETYTIHKTYKINTGILVTLWGDYFNIAWATVINWVPIRIKGLLRDACLR
ncbi:MAG: hypothetical protein COB16_19685 [Rhodobacteraceae bacterium]|nr:MAG: hypothetical protein COB16_19685 [Paracoccaceae bacterium]